MGRCDHRNAGHTGGLTIRSVALIHERLRRLGRSIAGLAPRRPRVATITVDLPSSPTVGQIAQLIYHRRRTGRASPTSERSGTNLGAPSSEQLQSRNQPGAPETLDALDETLNANSYIGRRCGWRITSAGLFGEDATAARSFSAPRDAAQLSVQHRSRTGRHLLWLRTSVDLAMIFGNCATRAVRARHRRC